MNKVQKILKFKQSDWLKIYTDFNTDKTLDWLIIPNTIWISLQLH